MNMGNKIISEKLMNCFFDCVGKSVCKYLAGQNGVTVSVVSNCGSGPGSGMGTGPGGGGAGGPSSLCQESNCLEDLEDSDGEVSKIDFRGVNLRTKKKRDGSGGSENECGAVGADNLEQQQPERPMSWEGELSDQEMSSNTLTNQVRFYSPSFIFLIVKFLSISGGAINDVFFVTQDHEETSMEGVQVCGASPGPQEQKFPIKPEPDFRSSPSLLIGSHNDGSLGLSHVQQMQQQQQQRGIDGLESTQQSDLPLLVGKLLGGYSSSTPNHSPILNPRHHLTKHSHTRSQVPSPDSAIHSAYSVFSSPTQSPHAARHSALGAGSPVPSSSLSRHSFNNSTSSLSLSLSHSLSRNNSDASSSCYSYGSLSPPTHSPIQQPRHSHAQHHHHHHQQQQQQQQQSSQLHETPTGQVTANTPVNTVPQSPNTRRRIFNFTPISPGPHSPINGRAASASKPSSANASPFVSPRNTPVPRSRSNLQSAGGSRARGQKSLARSISCSVPYTNTRQDTFVVPTSNSDNSRLAMTTTSLSGPRSNVEVQASNLLPAPLMSVEQRNDDPKVLGDPGATSFLGDIEQQKQLLINYPSQENLQEIKNVYDSCLTTARASTTNTTTNTTPTASNSGSNNLTIRNCQPAADQEISELLNGATRQQSFTTEQLYYRSQSVPLHRMVNPTLMSPIASNHSQFIANLQSFNNSSNSSIAPTPVPSEFNDFVSIGAHDTYLLDDVDAGFIADDQQFLMEDKESITKILNILDEEGRQSMTILPDRTTNDDNLLENTNLTIDLLDPLANADLSIQTESIVDPAVVLDPSVNGNLRKIIESRSYPNTPLPVVPGAYNAATYSNEDNNSNGSRSYPSTPLHTLQSQDIYRESNEPMLSSPTLNSLNLRAENVDVVNDNVCRNVTDLLETNFLGDNEADNDDLDPLGNFDGLQDVDSLTPLFNEVAETNR